MKPEDLPEEHRRFLDMSDNPKKPTNTSIFALLSDGLTKMNEKITGVQVKLSDKINGVQVQVAKIEVRVEERFKQQRREQKVVIAVVLATLSLVLWHLGIPLPLP